MVHIRLSFVRGIPTTQLTFYQLARRRESLLLLIAQQAWALMN
jgi:hypothetical protein